MSPLVDVELWLPQPNGTATRRGRTPLGGNEQGPVGFVRGVTVADGTNTGPRIAESQLSNYAGSFTNATAGQVITGLAISGNFDPNADNVTLRDSLITMGPAPTPGTTYLGFRGNRAGITGTRLEYVRIRPSVNSVDHYGMQGRDFTLLRCDIGGVVDGVVAHGYAGYTTGTVDIEDSFIHDLRVFADDPRQDGTPSHPDGVQAQGGIGLRIVGTTILGGATSAVLLTHDTGLAFQYVNLDQNWFDMEYPNGGAVVNASGTTAVNNLRITRNRFGRSSPTRPRLNISAATRNAATTYIPTSGPDANVFADNGSIVPITNG